VHIVRHYRNNQSITFRLFAVVLCRFFHPMNTVSFGFCFVERRTKTVTGARAFSVVAPKVWHDLPDSIRSSDSITTFKQNLKIYLFNQASVTSWLATYSLRTVAECLPRFSTVVVMRRSRTPSCQAVLTVKRVLLGQSTWDASWDAVAFS